MSKSKLCFGKLSGLKPSENIFRTFPKALKEQENKYSQEHRKIRFRYFWFQQFLHLSDCNWTGTHNHLVRKRILTHLAIWPVWLKGWVFVSEPCGCWFESSCSHLIFWFRACFEQGAPWHSGNYRVWIHSETRTWHNNTQSVFKSFISSSFKKDSGKITLYILPSPTC